MKPPPDPLLQLRNLGPQSVAWLHDVGVHTRDDLAALGPVLAYKLVAHRHAGAGLNLLYALYGALHDCPWNRLPPGVREALRGEAEEPLRPG